jgi:GNAT superfamily N-acetyltransferase
VTAIYVHPDFQKRGIGSRLLTRLEEEASSKGFRTLNLNAALNARSFYEANGYQVIRRTRFPLNEELSVGSLEMIKDI